MSCNICFSQALVELRFITEISLLGKYMGQDGTCLKYFKITATFLKCRLHYLNLFEEEAFYLPFVGEQVRWNVLEYPIPLCFFLKTNKWKGESEAWALALHVFYSKQCTSEKAESDSLLGLRALLKGPSVKALWWPQDVKWEPYNNRY